MFWIWCCSDAGFFRQSETVIILFKWTVAQLSHFLKSLLINNSTLQFSSLVKKVYYGSR